MNRQLAEKMMRRAIELSKQCSSSVYPNPKVGAVIFDDDGTICGEGFTQKYGGSHAEVVALSSLTQSANGLNMAVTLEPCNHYGKTPPCSLSIHQAGIKHVYIAKQEENSKAERGAEWLTQHAVSVDFMDEYSEEVVEINKFFFKNIREGRAWVTVKIAQSADGFIAAAQGVRTHISSPQSDKFVHTLRAEYPAIAVGAATVSADNPRLNVRLVKGENPLPVIYSASLSLPEDAVLYEAAPLVFTEQSDVAYLEKKGCVMEHLEHYNLVKTLEILLGKYNKNALLVEGGAKLVTAFFEQNLVDECIVITSPKKLRDGYPIHFDQLIDADWKVVQSQKCGEDTVERYRKIHS